LIYLQILIQINVSFQKKKKDFSVPEFAMAVEPIIIGGAITHLCVQCLSKFIIINVETNASQDVSLPVSKKVTTLLQHRGEAGLFIAYNSNFFFFSQFH